MYVEAWPSGCWMILNPSEIWTSTDHWLTDDITSHYNIKSPHVQYIILILYTVYTVYILYVICFVCVSPRWEPEIILTNEILRLKRVSVKAGHKRMNWIRLNLPLFLLSESCRTRELVNRKVKQSPLSCLWRERNYFFITPDSLLYWEKSINHSEMLLYSSVWMAFGELWPLWQPPSLLKIQLFSLTILKA